MPPVLYGIKTVISAGLRTPESATSGLRTPESAIFAGLRTPQIQAPIDNVLSIIYYLLCSSVAVVLHLQNKDIMY